jgi:tubby-related protein 1
VDVIGVKEQHHVVSKSAGEGSAATSAIAPAKADVKVPHSRNADDKHSHDSAEKPWEDDAPTDSRHTSTLSVYDCVHPGVHGEYVRCQVRRDRSAPLVATYRLVLEDTQTVLLMATKMQMNWTSNYHVFDMTRGVAGPLTKKSGNYLGKLRARDSDRSDCVLMSKATEPEELAAVRFNKISLVGQYLNGSSPRKMRVILPPIDNATMRPVPNRPDAPGHKSLLDMMRASDYGKYYVFETKEPVLEDATFRLDFKGRVTVASVKNFQLVSEDDLDHVVCQFGKVGTDAYTIDFQAPFNAVQAFALAICQFNL